MPVTGTGAIGELWWRLRADLPVILTSGEAGDPESREAVAVQTHSRWKICCAPSGEVCVKAAGRNLVFPAQLLRFGLTRLTPKKSTCTFSACWSMTTRPATMAAKVGARNGGEPTLVHNLPAHRELTAARSFGPRAARQSSPRWQRLRL